MQDEVALLWWSCAECRVAACSHAELLLLSCHEQLLTSAGVMAAAERGRTHHGHGPRLPRNYLLTTSPGIRYIRTAGTYPRGCRPSLHRALGMGERADRLRPIRSLEELAASRRPGARRPRRSSGGSGKGIAIAVIVAGLLIAGTLVAIELHRQWQVRQAVKAVESVFDKVTGEVESALADLDEDPPAFAALRPYTDPQGRIMTAVPASRLAWEYSDNEIRADEQYRDEVIAVTGVIDRLGRVGRGGGYVRLIGRRWVGIRCTMARGYDNDLVDVSPQRTVTIVGKVRGLGSDVNMSECRVTERE
jgi:tRNA_anti-like